MPGAQVTLDDEGLSKLHQAVLGLLPSTALAAASTYTDAEGTPVATRDGDVITLLAPSQWASPNDVRTDRPVAVAVDDTLPTDALPADAVLLLPTGGTRLDDHRHIAWATAWRAAATQVIETPVAPADAQRRRDGLAAAYSTGPLMDVPTRPMPSSHGRVVFFTGLSGSGKSTIAREVARRLAGERTVTLLDGDVVRTHLSKGLSFSKEDRDTNIRRIGWVAAEVAKHGGVAVCAPIAPYDDTRRWVRETVERVAGPDTFLLVHVSTPIEVCEQRDVKGLYAQARRGEITGFTGIDDPYESPTDAHLTLDTSAVGLEDAVDTVLSRLH